MQDVQGPSKRGRSLSPVRAASPVRTVSPVRAASSNRTRSCSRSASPSVSPAATVEDPYEKIRQLEDKLAKVSRPRVPDLPKPPVFAGHPK